MSGAGMLGAVERMLNALLRLDPDAPARLEPLAGTVLQVEIDSVTTVFVRFDIDGLSLLEAVDESPTAHIRGTPAALLALLGARGPIAAGVTVSGDVDALSTVRTAMAGLDLDWEERLSTFIGDAPAYAFGNAARAFDAWARRSGALALRDFSEYLREEAELAPGAGEVREFLGAVDAVRDDVERLGQRVQRLVVRSRCA